MYNKTIVIETGSSNGFGSSGYGGYGGFGGSLYWSGGGGEGLADCLVVFGNVT